MRIRKLELTESKRKLLASLKEEAGQPEEEEPRRIWPRAAAGPSPCSFGQERLWFLQQLQKENPAYNIAHAVRMEGALQVELLERSISEVIARHDSLRTTFEATDGRPQQVIRDRSNWVLERADLSNLPEADRVTAFQMAATVEARWNFDLANGPLLRAKLVRMAENEHVLVLVMHHIIADGWSMGVFVADVAALYDAFRLGKSTPLVPLAIQYPDFALWQRAEDYQGQLEFWLKRLEAAPPSIELPTDRPRPAHPTSRGGRESFTISAPLTRALRAVAQDEGTTLYATLLAALKVLLARCTGQLDLVVGSPVAGRSAQIERLIGFFVNTVVIRSDLTGQATLRDVLRLVAGNVMEVLANRDVPFDRIVASLRQKRDLRTTPLFNVLFVLQNAPLPPLELPDLRLSTVPLETGSAKFDLELAIVETGDELVGTWEYSLDLFDKTSIARFADRFRTVLQSFVDAPSCGVWDAPLLSRDEHDRVVVEWNETARDVADAWPHELFELQAARTGDAIALAFGDSSLTYAELNLRANQVAHHLRRLGVGPGSHVGLCVERSFEMLIGMLAILKAGGAYVALDPTYPAERVAFMLRDSDARVVVTTRASAAGRSTLGMNAVLLDAPWSFDGESPDNPIRHVTDATAYVIYTSGSTGQPKGVALGQRALANLIRWQLDSSPLSAGSRVLQFTSLSFDVSFQEILSTLASGGVLVLVDAEERRDPTALLHIIAQQSIARMFAPFVALQQLCETAIVRRLPVGLREAITAGEQLRIGDTIAQVFGERAARVLHNQYGPSEAHVVTSHTLPSDSSRWPALPPIGRPIDNTKMYVVDARLQPVPIGVAGELCIAGTCLAYGYVDRPELTAERFIPSPFSSNGERLYRTGDLARWRTDGEIDFLGRTDQQLKIRGFRVELGEIESVLASHPEVVDGVVVARDTPAGGKYLAAYLVGVPPSSGPAQADRELAARLRAHLARVLPEYMVPAAFFVIPSLPLTASGKVNRRALPVLEVSFASVRDYVAPRGPIEEALARAWTEVLAVERVGAHDDFFELGGDSISAAQVVARLAEAFHLELTVPALFDAPTVASLARRIEAGLQAGQATAAEPVTAVDRCTELPLSSGQERFWFLTQLNPEGPSHNLPGAFRLEGPVHVEALRRGIETVVHRHEALRTTFHVLHGRPVQRIQPPSRLDLPLTDLSAMAEDEARRNAQRRIYEQGRRPLDVGTGPLYRAELIRIRANEHVLLWTVHHIVWDGWSSGVMIREIGQTYAALVAGQAAELPPLSFQYADYAHWQRRRLLGNAVDERIGYWKKQLAGAPALQLPTDYPRAPVQRHRGGRYLFELPRSLVDGLRGLGRRERATLFMTLLAGFSLVLSRHSQQEDIVVGTPVSNRAHADAENLIGLFINALALRTDLSGEPTFLELLERVRRTSLEAYARQDIPVERLVAELSSERDLSRMPLFQTVFALHNAPAPPLVLGDLTIAAIDDVGDTFFSECDLTVDLWDRDGGLMGSCLYDADLFREATVARLMDHFVNVLGAALRDPAARISDLDLMSDPELRRITVEWNETTTALPADALLHDRFEEHARMHGDTIAVVSRDAAVTYRELDARADLLANYLRGLGVGPDVLVGISMDRCVELMVAILGVLKSGGAYLPLDPSYSRERLGFMLEETRAPVLITQKHLSSALPPTRARVISLDDAETSAAIKRAPVTVGPRPDPGGLAYVIYTSGSTGAPKGIAIAHRGVLNNIVDLNRRFDVSPGDAVLALSSLSFDMCVYETVGMMEAGATVVIPDPELRKDPAHWCEMAEQHRITIWNSAPSLLELFVDAWERRSKRSGCARRSELRLALLGGDWVPVPLPDRLRALAPRARVIVMGGATEASIHSIIYEVERVDPAWTSIPYGKPMANQYSYVLDARLGAAPVGVPGEIHLGGIGLARGYAQRPDLTADRFRPSPFAPNPGQRVYRTGDLARYGPDGTIELIGRVDFQVKVRGFRIELGDIVAALRRHPAVLDAVAAPWVDGSGGRWLVGYYVLHAGSSCSSEELTKHLRQQLPEYMVPGAFVELDRLPLSPNGKVDRLALPAPSRSRTQTTHEADFVEPRNAVETVVAHICADMLGLDKVSVVDNFFNLGGHSVLATQVQSRLIDALGVDVPLRLMFEAPTIAALAERLLENATTAGIDLLSVARILLSVEQLSDAEAREMLAESSSP